MWPPLSFLHYGNRWNRPRLSSKGWYGSRWTCASITVASQASSQTKSRGLRSKARAKQSSCRSPNLWFSKSLSHSVSLRTTKPPKTCSSQQVADGGISLILFRDCHCVIVYELMTNLSSPRPLKSSTIFYPILQKPPDQTWSKVGAELGTPRHPQKGCYPLGQSPFRPVALVAKLSRSSWVQHRIPTCWTSFGKLWAVVPPTEVIVEWWATWCVDISCTLPLSIPFNPISFSIIFHHLPMTRGSGSNSPKGSRHELAVSVNAHGKQYFAVSHVHQDLRETWWSHFHPPNFTKAARQNHLTLLGSTTWQIHQHVVKVEYSNYISSAWHICAYW